MTKESYWKKKRKANSQYIVDNIKSKRNLELDKNIIFERKRSKEKFRKYRRRNRSTSKEERSITDNHHNIERKNIRKNS